MNENLQRYTVMERERESEILKLQPELMSLNLPVCLSLSLFPSPSPPVCPGCGGREGEALLVPAAAPRA